jgi:fibronectin-binding autotransporter adhesin
VPSSDDGKEKSGSSEVLMDSVKNALSACLMAMALVMPPALHAATITVTTTADEFGSGSACSIREAVQSANTNADVGGCTHAGGFGTDTITIPAGFYTLTRGGIDEDNNATGDIDIRSNLTLQGAGAGTTSIALCGNCSDRVLQVVLGTSVTINDVTLRDGDLPNGRAGAGLRTEPNTSTALNRVTVGLNTVDGNAGGILNRGSMFINASAVTNNVTVNATQGGGGIFNDDNAHLIINDSRILDNQTTGNGANGSGAGIYNDVGAELTIINSTIDGNTIDIGGTISGNVIGDGGGIFSAGSFQITQSTISHNTANGNDARGGGISCDTTEATFSGQATSSISLSLIFANHADDNPDVSVDLPNGGGVFATCRKLTITDSVVSSNTSDGSGGGLAADSTVDISRSTFSANVAQRQGGGLDLASSTTGRSRFSVVNTSVLNNQSGGAGGGIHTSGSSGALSILNSTIAGNTSSANGGGIHISLDTLEAMGRTVIAGNLAAGSAIHDDCDGNVTSNGFNLIQSASGCVLSGSNSDLVNVNALLAAATNNGGPVTGASNGTVSGMLTRAPLPASPLIDAGPFPCVDQNANPLTTDQVGRNRNLDGPDPDSFVDCDIGAIEFVEVDRIFASGFD